MEAGIAGISYQRTSGHITKTQQWLELYTEQILDRWDKFSDGGPRVYELLSHRIQQLHERLSDTAIYEYGLKQITNTPETDGTWHKTRIMPIVPGWSCMGILVSLPSLIKEASRKESCIILVLCHVPSVSGVFVICLRPYS